VYRIKAEVPGTHKSRPTFARPIYARIGPAKGLREEWSRYQPHVKGSLAGAPEGAFSSTKPDACCCFSESGYGGPDSQLFVDVLENAIPMRSDPICHMLDRLYTMNFKEWKAATTLHRVD
jgi:hypothetical protein